MIGSFVFSSKRVAILCLMLGLSGCGGDTGRKETYPVTGVVIVDDQPAANLAVKAHPVAGIDPQNPTISSAFTDNEGRFTFSTYDTGDGIPEGEYKLTFFWGEMNMFSMQYGGPDKLKDRYKDAGASEFSIKVGPDQPVDLGSLTLTTE